MNIQDYQKIFTSKPPKYLVKKGIIICPDCQINPAELGSLFGTPAVFLCTKCQKLKWGREPMKNNLFDLSEGRLQEQRRANVKDIVQPWRYGEPSKEFAETYPGKAKHYFKNEKKPLKRVWGKNMEDLIR